MKKILVFTALVCMLAVGCTKEEITLSPESDVRFTLQICREEPRTLLRAADETAVQDVNVFLFDPQGIRPSQHFYVRGDVVECAVPAGRYDVYAVANLHEDMGPMSRAALLEYEFRVSQSYASLPMSGYAECTVGKGAQSATITVRRNVAKIVCNISINGSGLSALKLQSVQMMDMASSAVLFAEGQKARELSSSPLSAIASYENRKASRTFFLAENCRGEVPGIASQQQKCAGNAPAGATFLRIRAQREGKLLTYDVYLGENNTTNFDVRRNTVHTLNIVIKGENTVDTRVDAFEVGISDNFPYEGYQFEGYCMYDPGKRLTITVDDPSKAGNLTATIRFLQGQSGGFFLYGQPLTSFVTVPLDNPSGVYSFPVDYMPGRAYTAENYRLVYEVAVSNADGYSYTKTFTHDFYNHLTVYSFWGNRERAVGNLRDITAVRWISTLAASEHFCQILSLDDGPIMPFVTADGFGFEGWYADRGLTRRISQDNPYRYPMTSFRDTLYANTVRESVYIYSDLDNIVIESDKGYRTDPEKEAFIVPPGSRCTLRAVAGKTVAVWWSNKVNHYPRKELSREPAYSFTAQTNFNAIPEFQTD